MKKKNISKERAHFYWNSQYIQAQNHVKSITTAMMRENATVTQK